MAEIENHVCDEDIARAFRNSWSEARSMELLREAEGFMIWLIE